MTHSPRLTGPAPQPPAPPVKKPASKAQNMCPIDGPCMEEAFVEKKEDQKPATDDAVS